MNLHKTTRTQTSIVVLAMMPSMMFAQAFAADNGAASFDWKTLKAHQLTANCYCGNLPSPEILPEMARQAGIKRIICLFGVVDSSNEFIAATQSAGLTPTYIPIVSAPTTDGADYHVDREAVKRVVSEIANTNTKTYVCHRPKLAVVGMVEFAYQISQDRLCFADAMKETANNGFITPIMHDLVAEMKLLAAGTDKLPTVKALPISDSELQSSGKSVRIRGLRHNVKVMGKGPAIYILHGGPGENHMLLRPYLDALSENHTLVYYDQRGCGESDKPQFLEAYKIEQYVEDLEALRVALGHSRMTLLAHSTGGIIATLYAKAYPQNVEKLVISSSWTAAEEVQPYIRLSAYLLPQDSFKELMDVQDKIRAQRRRPNDEELAEMVQISFAPHFFGEVDHTFRSDWKKRTKISSLAYAGLAPQVFGTVDTRSDLSSLSSIPTLMITGKYDVITPSTVMQTFADSIAGSRLVIFEKSGHYPYIEENERFIRLVREFLDKGKPDQVPSAS